MASLGFRPPFLIAAEIEKHFVIVRGVYQTREALSAIPGELWVKDVEILDWQPFEANLEACGVENVSHLIE